MKAAENAGIAPSHCPCDFPARWGLRAPRPQALGWRRPPFPGLGWARARPVARVWAYPYPRATPPHILKSPWLRRALVSRFK